MGIVLVQVTMSLDGFIAGSNDKVDWVLEHPVAADAPVHARYRAATGGLPRAAHWHPVRIEEDQSGCDLATDRGEVDLPLEAGHLP